MFRQYSLQFLLYCGLFLCFHEALYAQDSNLYNIFQYRQIGPSRGGRVTAVAGIQSLPATYYMGSTGGGLWKTEDYGTSWKNVSDGYFQSPSIGAIRVVQTQPNIVYAGTGSDGLRSNVISGKGVYKSVDAGKSWDLIGLEKSGHIGAIEIHPYLPNTVFVAAIGQAFNPNPERGLYRTRDGGKNWEQVLFIADSVGAVDVEFCPGNPDVIYASVWRAERKPWTIISGSDQDGIYKSEDGGDTWRKIESGLPDMMGKIDFAVCPAKPSLVYALIEADTENRGLYISEDYGESFELVSNKPDLTVRPFYYTNVDVDPQDPNTVYVCATRYFRSKDGGKSWTQLRPPHGDNHDMWINPDNPQLFIQGNDGGANVTHNGGKTWSTQFNQPTSELYQVEVDDQYPYWLYAGQQDNYTAISVPSMPPHSHQAGVSGYLMDVGGCETGPAVPKPGSPHIVYANCKGRFSVFNKHTGQEQHYDVGAAYMYGHNPKDLKFRFQRVSPIHVSPHDPGIIYHTSQYVHKSTDEGKSWEIISPDLTAFKPEMQVISGSPLTRDITGEEFYSTIYSIRESKIEAGQLWVGANDGPVHVSQNGGKDWTNVTPEMPPDGRVDCVEPSPHDPAKAYVAVLRYQLGDWKPYIFRTNNYGQDWQLLTNGSNGIPADVPTRVIREDPNRAGLLFAGTDVGIFISFDDGENWQAFQQNLPLTPVTDLKIHRQDLVLSTMGRGFWIMDDLSPLYQELDQLNTRKAMLFAPRENYRFRRQGGRGTDPIAPAIRYPAPALVIDYYLPKDAKDSIHLEIQNSQGAVLRQFSSSGSRVRAGSGERDMATGSRFNRGQSRLSSKAGLHRFRYDMRHSGAWDSKSNNRYQNGPYLSPGAYKVVLVYKGNRLEQEINLLLNPALEAQGISQDDLEKQEAFCLEIVSLQSAAKKMAHEIKERRKELKETQDKWTDSEKAEDAALKSVEELLVQAKGNYTQPMLISQIGYLYGIVSRADQLPGKDAYVRLEELKKEFAEVEGQYKKVSKP